MASVFCNSCGHRNPPDANFCSSCGTLLAVPASDATTVTFQPIDMVVEGDEDASVVVDGVGEAGLLVVKRGPNVGTRYTLAKEVTRVGRHPESDIFLDDITVSRRHAEIHRDEDGYLVTDAGSLNGTYVNRERIEKVRLDSGDEVQIGKFKLVYLAAVGE